MEKTTIWAPAVSEYLEEWILEFRSPAFLSTNRTGEIISSGGSLVRYGLDRLCEGDRAAEKIYALEGLLPLEVNRLVLERVETAPGVFADIHLFRAGLNDCTLLLDASADVSERMQIEQALRHTQEQLRHAEKMQALGRLAGGVAHDFNNLLTVILGYSQMLTEALPKNSFGLAAREINEAAKMAANMTHHLLSFSRRQVRHVEVLDLKAVIPGLDQLMRRLIGEDIVLTTDIDPALALVEADRSQIEQVFINLAANARDAMPRGGTLVIRAANLLVDDAFTASHPAIELRHGPYVSLSVKDSGCGMDAETRARVFEPFFTSKPSGQGTGLGLSIVYGIVTQSGGEVHLVSELGEGTCVEILLPAVDKSVALKNAAEKSLAGGTETVLVVEDEDAVRKLVCEVLTTLGYTVLESVGPSAALELSERYPGRIDLLMTDIIMPEMDGNELAARILVGRPEIPVLYVSGYAKESFARRGVDVAGSIFLPKPFTSSLLADRVRKALSR